MLTETTTLSSTAGALQLASTDLRGQVLDLSRQNRIGALSPWFSAELDRQIAAGHFLPADKLAEVSEGLVRLLVAYREEAGVSTCVLGMSGGVDSALTASLFKKAGWKVIGVTLPVHQDPSETERGVEAIRALGLDEHIHVDLTAAYDALLPLMNDSDIVLDDGKATKIRRGNVRARLRMITLFNLAAKNRGLVGSTDNLSERQAGFWTLAGDIGNCAPIQSLTKSWEVPALAVLNGVPASTVRATPTDGLGIDAGDEAQLGCSYLEWDLIARAVGEAAQAGMTPDALAQALGISEPSDRAKFDAVLSRMKATWFKRMDPVNLPHPLDDRYGLVERTDHRLFVPRSFARNI